MRQSVNNRSIKDFFKPFTIPKNRIPKNDVIEDEIIVASPKPSSPSSNLRSRQSTASPVKQTHSRTSSARSSKASTPTKRSPTVTPKKRTSALHLDSATNDALVHISPSSAQKREMMAVEIPSSMPPPLPEQKRETPTRSAATSFSSTSTLSSVPMSSQSSSRRIVKGGIQAVTNSDSGSADSDSDDLADPSTFVVSKRRKLTPPPGQDVEHAIEIPSTVKPARQSTRLSDKGKRSSNVSTPRLSLSPPKTVYKHSLLNMVKQREKEEKTEARLKQVENAFEEAQRKREEQLKLEEDLGGGMKAAMADDSDEGERMMLAMARTEAMQDEKKFYYFRKGDPFPAKQFPTSITANAPTSWTKLLVHEGSRTQAFLSGFVAEMARQRPIPNEICSWIESQLGHEARKDLCEAYVEVLRACAERATQPYIGYSQLDYVYNTLDREYNNLESEFNHETAAANESSSHRDFETDGLPQGLRYVIRAMQHSWTRHAIKPLFAAASVVGMMLASIDENVKRHADLQVLIHDGIEHILNAHPDHGVFEETCEFAHERFFGVSAWADLSLQLQCRAIASLPASTERSHRLRRLLAVHLITNKTREDQRQDDLTAPRWADAIVARLKKAPVFKISESTDYALLNSLIVLLDIAIDAGFSDFAFRSSNPVSTRPTGPFGKQSTTTSAESAFNSQIDAITSQLRLMSSRIRDAGTSHLRRTEAKSAIERLAVKLVDSVRTRPKPRKGIFGGNTGEQRRFLSGFLKPVQTNNDESESVSIVPVDLLSDREGSDHSEASAVSGAEAS